jgi:GTP-binding protein
MLIDEVKIKVKAGDGGSGAVAFDKNKFAKGPAGGSGGKEAIFILSEFLIWVL